MGDRRPVGFFDSGVGGISVLKVALELLPRESFIYFGDNANAPYGTKTAAEIKSLAFDCADFLVSRGVKAIVVACNTATSAAIRDIRERLNLPVISMEPAIKPALAAAKEGKVLMVATPATCSLERYQLLLDKLGGRDKVINVGLRGLVERIELGDLSPCGFAPGRFDDLLHAALCPYEGERIDAIVLGCTHYPFIERDIAAYAAAHFTGARRFFDGNGGTVRQLAKVLRDEGLASDGPGGKTELYTSGDEKVFLPLMRSLLREKTYYDAPQGRVASEQACSAEQAKAERVAQSQ